MFKGRQKMSVRSVGVMAWTTGYHFGRKECWISAQLCVLNSRQDEWGRNFTKVYKSNWILHKTITLSHGVQLVPQSSIVVSVVGEQRNKPLSRDLKVLNCCTVCIVCVCTVVVFTNRAGIGLPLYLCPCILLLNCHHPIPLLHPQKCSTWTLSRWDIVWGTPHPCLPKQIFNLDIVLVGHCPGYPSPTDKNFKLRHYPGTTLFK